MLIRDLEMGDAAQLLEFELQNRSWFEQFVTPRGERFYTQDAVRDHIRAYLLAKQQGRFHGCLVLSQDGQIMARANLREISVKQSSAEVGYRVGQAFTGQGVASAATQYLIGLATHQWQIRTLRGFVSVENPASSRVLEKNQFVRVALHPGMSILRDRKVDAIEYVHRPCIEK